jgi:transposase
VAASFMNRSADLLNIPGLRATEIVGDDRRYVVSAALVEAPPPCCPFCGGRTILHERRRLDVADLPMHGKPVRLLVAAPRRLCTLCRKTTSPAVVGLDAERRMTARLADYVAQRGLERPYAAIALEVGLGAATVAQVCRAHIARCEAVHRPAAPRIISLDEVHISKGKDFAVISDHDGGRAVVELLDRTKGAALAAALRRLGDAGACTAATIDMCHRYRDAIHAALPGATIVVDKFHVLQMARRALLTVLAEEYKCMPKAGRASRLELRGWLIKRGVELKQGPAAARLHDALAGVPRLAAAYAAKEDFWALYDCRSLDDAASHLDAWQAALDPTTRFYFRELTTALGNWRPEILAYWTTGKRLTNGSAEGLNAAIKRINAAGGGDLPFRLLRAWVLFGEAARRRRAA